MGYGIDSLKKIMENPVTKKIIQANWSIALLAAFVLLAIWPGVLFFRYYGAALMASTTPQSVAYGLFPLFGTYAVFLVWLQVLIGMHLPVLRRRFSKIDLWHRYEGIAALTTAVLHPLLLIIGIGLINYLQPKFIPPGKIGAVILGDLALVLLVITVVSALLMRWSWLQRRWHTLHYLNYAVFAAAWLHGWFIGSASRFPVMQRLWVFYALTFIISLTVKLTRAYDRRRTATVGALTGIKLASVKEVVEGRPFCATVGDAKLAVFFVDGRYYATDNLCTHAGGPICQGSLEGDTVTCPWHGTRYDVKTGKVRRGPAELDLKTYPLEVINGEIRLKKGVETGRRTTKPLAVTPKYLNAFEAERPFTHKPFLEDVLNGLKFPFKLYGLINQVLIGHGPDEIDVHLGSVHITRQDIGQLERLFDGLNAKWQTQITYCLYHTSQFPDDFILNVRGPKAPTNTAMNIQF